MDHAEPPRIVFEPSADCSDAVRAAQLLERTLAPTRAPGRAWTVSFRATRGRAEMRAEGEITDATGAPVAHRSFVRALTPEAPQDGGPAGQECAGLARAVGVWASLVLDAELSRPPPAAGLPAGASAQETAVAPWPAPAVNERPSPEHFALLKHPEGTRSLEVGASSFIMSGITRGGLVGPQLYMVIEASDALFLRPSLAFGRTFQSISRDVYGTWGAGRFDACLRIPGLYRDQRGLQLDTCLGADLGFLRYDQASVPPGTTIPAASRTLPFLAAGPALGFRGELGSDLSVDLRGVAGYNLLRETFVDTTGTAVEQDAWTLRGELGLTWRLR